MSVILESLPGDEFICIEPFYGCPQGEPFSWNKARHLKIGERLKFVGSYLDDHFREHPSGWMVIFDAADGKRYDATQTYFVLPDCWEGLRKHFAQQQRKAPSRKNTKTVNLQPSRKRQAVTSASKKRRSA